MCNNLFIYLTIGFYWRLGLHWKSIKRPEVKINIYILQSEFFVIVTFCYAVKIHYLLAFILVVWPPGENMWQFQKTQSQKTINNTKKFLSWSR